MKTVAVIFGGMSTEHDVSIMSGKSVIKNIDREKYNVKAVYIDKNSTWYECKLNDNGNFNIKEDISKIASTYHNWRNDSRYEDELGFCKSATIEEVKENDFSPLYDYDKNNKELTLLTCNNVNKHRIIVKAIQSKQ